MLRRAITSSLVMLTLLSAGCSGGGSSSSPARLASTAATTTQSTSSPTSTTGRTTSGVPMPGAVQLPGGVSVVPPGSVATTPGTPVSVTPKPPVVSTPPGTPTTPTTTPTTPTTPTTTPTTPTTPSTAPAFLAMQPTQGKVGDQVGIVLQNVSTTLAVGFGTINAPIVSGATAPGGYVQVNVQVPQGAVTGHVYVYDGASQKTLDCGVFTVTGTTPTTTPTTPTTTPTTPSTAAPMIASASLDDTNGNHVIDAGDKLTLHFNQPVSLSSNDPNGQIAPLVPGDSFGAGATMAPGATPNDVVITLGQKPVLHVGGNYAPGSTASSGVDVAPGATAIKSATGVAAKAGSGIDLGSSTFVEGCFQVGIQMNYSRGLHSATLLADGRVLVVGGVTSDGPGNANYQTENEIYDPATNSFMALSDSVVGSAAPYMARVDQGGVAFRVGRYAHAAVLLADGTGRVLIAGGHGFEDRDATGNPVYGELTSCFLFDPKTMSFRETGPLGHERRDATAIAFNSGKVLIMGGRDRDGTLATTEVYDPATGQWTAGPSLTADLYDAAIVPATTGILIAGGAKQTGRQTTSSTLTNIAVAERFDTQSSTFVATGTLVYPRRAATGTLLSNGDVLVAGGTDASGASMAQIEVWSATTGAFTPVGSLQYPRARAAAKRVDADVLVVGGVSFDASGKLVTVDSVERVNANGQSTSSPLTVSRVSHTVTHLNDGRILILGGFRQPTSDIRGIDGYSNYTGEIFSKP